MFVAAIALFVACSRRTGCDYWKDNRRAALCKLIIDLAKSLGSAPVAIGLESGADTKKLTELGCSIGQGYYLSEPMPLTDLIDLLRARASRMAMHISPEVVHSVISLPPPALAPRGDGPLVFGKERLITLQRHQPRPVVVRGILKSSWSSSFTTRDVVKRLCPHAYAIRRKTN